MVDGQLFKAAFQRSPVVFFGETHNFSITRDFIISHIEQFRDAGVTHIAIELPLDFQHNIDEYYNTGDEEGILKIFNLEDRVAKDMAYSFLRLIKAAKENGIFIQLFDVSTTVRSDSLDVRLSDRYNSQLATNIYSIIVKNPQAKIAVLCGGMHAKKSMIPRYLMDNFSVQSTSFDVVSIKPFSRDRNFDGVIIGVSGVGQMKPLSRRDPNTPEISEEEKNKIEALAKAEIEQGQFETIDVTVVEQAQEKIVQAKVVKVDLGKAGGDHFNRSAEGTRLSADGSVADQQDIIIVVNSQTSKEVQEEAKYHEAREIYLMSQDKSQHEAHVIASAETRQDDKRFIKQDGLTAYDMWQLINMTAEERQAIIEETEADREWQHNVIRDAGINVDEAKEYEARLRQMAQNMNGDATIEDMEKLASTRPALPTVAVSPPAPQTYAGIDLSRIQITII
ncbi:MAG: hypothetical protein AB1755_04255 [Candidatus Omnitrophota bacterium]